MSTELNFGRLFVEFRRGMLLLVALAIVGACIAFGLSYAVEPRYESAVVMMPVNEDDLLGSMGISNTALTGLLGAAGLGSPTKSREREALAILQSRTFIVDFFREGGRQQLLFPDLWDASKNEWRSDGGQPPSDNSIYGRFFTKVMKVKRNTETGLVSVAIRIGDRSAAADWANGLVRTLNATMRLRAVTESERSLNYLQRELKRTDIVEIRQGIFALVEGQTKEIMMANVRDDFAMRVIDAAPVPDEGAYVVPNRLLLSLLGAVIGIFLAAIVIVLRAGGAETAQASVRGSG